MKSLCCFVRVSLYYLFLLLRCLLEGVVIVLCMADKWSWAVVVMIGVMFCWHIGEDIRRWSRKLFDDGYN